MLHNTATPHPHPSTLHAYKTAYYTSTHTPYLVGIVPFKNFHGALCETPFGSGLASGEVQIRGAGGPEHSVSVSESTRRVAAACSTLPQRSALSRNASPDPNGVRTTHHESSQKGTHISNS